MCSYFFLLLLLHTEVSMLQVLFCILLFYYILIYLGYLFTSINQCAFLLSQVSVVEDACLSPHTFQKQRKNMALIFFSHYPFCLLISNRNTDKEIMLLATPSKPEDGETGTIHSVLCLLFKLIWFRFALPFSL